MTSWENSDLTLEVLSPRILSLRQREEKLEAGLDDAVRLLQERRIELPTTEEMKEYVADLREYLQEGTIPQRKALIRHFVKGITVLGNDATLTYTIPMPKDGVIQESASVLTLVQSPLPTTTNEAPTSGASSFFGTAHRQLSRAIINPHIHAKESS